MLLLPPRLLRSRLRRGRMLGRLRRGMLGGVLVRLWRSWVLIDQSEV